MGESGRPGPLDRLRDEPYLRSGAELSRGIGHLDEVLTPGRVTALAQFAAVAKAQAVARMPLQRRTATRLACVTLPC